MYISVGIMCTLITIASLISLMQNGFTTLYKASQNGHKGVVELLLNKRANVNHQNKSVIVNTLNECIHTYKRKSINDILYNMVNILTDTHTHWSPPSSCEVYMYCNLI